MAYRFGREQAVEQIDYLYVYGTLEEADGPAVRVVTEALRVREEAGLSGASVNNQFGGAAGVLLAVEPRWVDGFWWWNIRFADGTLGWAAHGDAEEHWLGDEVGAPLPLPADPSAALAMGLELSATSEPTGAPISIVRQYIEQQNTPH